MQEQNQVSPGTIFFGKTIDGNKNIYLSDQSRLSNTMIISTKNSGKSKYLIPLMVNQDMNNKDAGITIIAGRSEMAYDLYAMAKRHRRKGIHLLKPSTNFAVLNTLLYAKNWDYDQINQEIIDYKQAIRDRDVVIIDMEVENYSMHAIKATAMLLMQLQSDMNDTETTLRRRHYVYIDEAYRYLNFLGNLLEYGDDYNISSTLFFQSRSQFKTQSKDYTDMLDNNVRNTILLQGLNYDDAIYYGKRIKGEGVRESKADTLLYSSFGQFSFEIIGDVTFKRMVGTGRLIGLDDNETQEIHKMAVKHRKVLQKELKQKIIDKRLQLVNEKEALYSLSNRLDTDTKNSYLDVIEQHVMNQIEKQTPDSSSLIANKEENKKEDIKEASPEEDTLPAEVSEDSSRPQIDEDNEPIEVDLSEAPDEMSNLDIPEDLSVDLEGTDDLGSDLSDERLPDFDEIVNPGMDDLVVDDDIELALDDSDKKENDIKEDNPGFDISQVDFLIDGKIETDIIKGIKSAKPIRIKMPYKSMKNQVYGEDFKKYFE